MGNEIEKVASGQLIVQALERVADEAWESHNNEDIPIVEVDEHVLNRPPTFLQQLNERRKEIVTVVCVVGCMVVGALLASALIGRHYNSILGMFFNPASEGAVAGGYVGYQLAKFLTHS